MPQTMVERIADVTSDWSYGSVSVGIPSPVHAGHVVAEPVNLGTGWVGFDFQEAFGRPTKVVNDAAMQALGSYEDGRMLFLGLETGLGTALVVDGIVEPMELATCRFESRPMRGTSGSAVSGLSARRNGARRFRR
jgi:polyphosphate glucokinase